MAGSSPTPLSTTDPPSPPPDIVQIASGDSAEEDPDEVWERNFERIDSGKDDELKPIFNHLHASKQRVQLIQSICSGDIDVEDYYLEGNKQELLLYHDVKNGNIRLRQYGKKYNGPFVLAKNVTPEQFEKWLECEWGLHKSVRLDTGTVYVPQACTDDHGDLRIKLASSDYFPILGNRLENNRRAIVPKSGKTGNMNPDTKWRRPNERTPCLVAEVGISQSLPDLRRKAHSYCADEVNYCHLQYVVLIKRGEANLYVEIWARNEGGARVPNPIDFFKRNDKAPENMGLPDNCCMHFVANCCALRPGAQASRGWQGALTLSCDIPAGHNFVQGNDEAIHFNATELIEDLDWQE